MPLDRDELRRIARLARLALTAEEEHLFAAQLGRVVDYFDRLRELEADAPTADHTPGATGADDVPEPGLPRDVVLALAPAAADGHFLVPPVLVSPAGAEPGGARTGSMLEARALEHEKLAGDSSSPPAALPARRHDTGRAGRSEDGLDAGGKLP